MPTKFRKGTFMPPLLAYLIEERKMYLKELLIENRSYRRFHEDRPIRPELLVELVDMARLCPSGANRQPLKYVTIGL